jgi:hypothetical protein
VFTIVAIGVVWLFVMNGGPSWVGQLWADIVGAP